MRNMVLYIISKGKIYINLNMNVQIYGVFYLSLDREESYIV